jgi:hypothetical protein
LGLQALQLAWQKWLSSQAAIARVIGRTRSQDAKYQVDLAPI